MIVETIHVYMYDGNIPHFSSICLEQHLYLCYDFFTTFTTGLPRSTIYKNFTNLVFHQDDLGPNAEMTKMLVMVFCS